MGSIATLKQDVVTRLMEQQDFILLLINPGAPGVKLPEELLRSTHPVGINIGWRMAIPVPDLKLDQQGIRGTLSFNREPFLCHFPWASVLQVTADDEHLIWILPEAEAEPDPPDADGEPEPGPKKPALKLV